MTKPILLQLPNGKIKNIPLHLKMTLVFPELDFNLESKEKRELRRLARIPKAQRTEAQRARMFQLVDELAPDYNL